MKHLLCILSLTIALSTQAQKQQKIYYVNSKGKFVHPVIAWYCPEIPYKFGPAGYGGLPGMILELQEKNNVFGAIKIELKAPLEKIQIPKKGIKISHQEYQNLFIKLSKSRF